MSDELTVNEKTFDSAVAMRRYMGVALDRGVDPLDLLLSQLFTKTSLMFKDRDDLFDALREFYLEYKNFDEIIDKKDVIEKLQSGAYALVPVEPTKEEFDAFDKGDQTE